MSPSCNASFFPVVAELAETHSVEVVFVDDGSTDETYQALDRRVCRRQRVGVCRSEFERHAVNRGLGAALRTGFAAARGDIVITTDSDGTYQFSEIPVLLIAPHPRRGYGDGVALSPGGRCGGCAALTA